MGPDGTHQPGTLSRENGSSHPPIGTTATGHDTDTTKSYAYTGCCAEGHAQSPARDTTDCKKRETAGYCCGDRIARIQGRHTPENRGSTASGVEQTISEDKVSLRPTTSKLTRIQ